MTRQLDALWVHASWCFDAPLSTPACKSFWSWVTIALVAIGSLILWRILAGLGRHLRAWLAETRRRARERKIADEETMAQYKADDSKLYPDHVPENVEQKIRDALAEKKRTDQERPHHQMNGRK